MKMCQIHWNQMCDAIKSRGLWHLVAQSGEAAAERAMDELKGTATDKTYDPLMALNWMIINRAIEIGGLTLMGENTDGTNDGHYCPLCVMRKSFDHHNTSTGRCGDPKCRIQMKPGDRPTDEVWIEGASNAVLKYCQERELTAPPQ